MATATHQNSLYERPGLPVNARWELEWSQSWFVAQRQFCSGYPTALSHCVCWRERHNCPPPQSPADWENWKSHFISEEMSGWELCGVGKQSRLNYRAAWCCSQVYTLTLCPDTTWSLRRRLFPRRCTSSARHYRGGHNSMTSCTISCNPILPLWRWYCPVRRQRHLLSNFVQFQISC